MREAEKTIGNMIDKLKIAFLGSVDEEGFPNVKAMLQPRKREGIRRFICRQILHRCVLHNSGKTIVPVCIFVIRGFIEEQCCVAR